MSQPILKKDTIGANCVTVPVGDIKRCTLSDGVGKQV